MKIVTIWKLFWFYEKLQKLFKSKGTIMGKFISGYKTYIAGFALIALGAKQIFVDNQLDAGLQSIFAGIAIMAGRSAIDKIGK